MMYHIRIDYFDNKIKVVRTFFEYDYPTKENVVNDVLLPYLQGKSFIFGGAKVEDGGIRKVEIYETKSSIDKAVEMANGTASPMMTFIPYTREDMLRDELVPKVTRQLIQEVQEQIKLQKKNEQKVETKKEKKPMLFISHSSEDEAIASSLVTMLRTLGFNKRNLFCSSVPGYDIPEGEDIYDALATKFIEYDIYVILLLSKNYYDSVACLNEMGATWVLKAKYSTIVCPGFTVPEIKGAVNPRKMAVALDDSKRVNGKLNQLKDHLIEFFHLPEVEDDTIWENDRNEFLKSIDNKKYMSNQASDNNKRIAKNKFILCFSMVFVVLSAFLCLSSCSDKDYLNGKNEGMLEITMRAPDFLLDSKNTLATKSTLIPSTGGTIFRWGIGDVAGVYSSGRGLTNFFIDESSISEDGSSARFNGSGFTLSPDSRYYSFYPYRADALDKEKIPVSYSGQNLEHNGAFKELGKYDYMTASGQTNEDGNVNFNFEHVGCVVELNLQVPETATYNQVRLELEDASNGLAFVKSGNVNATAGTFTANNSLSADTIMRVNLNGDEGLMVKKDSLLKVYMMVAPQDLSGQKMIVRLVDSNSQWYTAKVVGRNMKSGYTYHYNVTDKSELGGFTGKGHGLPDDYTYRLISSYKDSKIKPYEDLVVDGNIVYAVGGFGVRKINYEDERNPYVMKSSDLGYSSMRFRSIAEKDDYLYVSLRQGSSGANEDILPKLKLNFETHADSYSTKLSNSDILNGFFLFLALQSGSATDVTLAYLYKAYKKSSNEYRNSILLKFKNGSSVTFVGNSYTTREAALNSLKSIYRTNNGDECVVDWSALPEGGNVVKNIKMNNMGQFHSYQSVGSAKIDELGSPCPNTGLYSARLMTGSSVQTVNSAILKRNLENATKDGEITFWIKPSCLVKDKIEIPLLSTGVENKLKLSLDKNDSYQYKLGLMILGKICSSSVLLNTRIQQASAKLRNVFVKALLWC